MKYSIVTFLLFLLLFAACRKDGDKKKILVFSKTSGLRHESISTGKQSLIKLGQQNGFAVDTTENAAYFNDDSLKQYRAVVFLNTSENVLNEIQQVYFKRFIEAGGGFVGIHSAADTENDWFWYGKLVGANFMGAPETKEVKVNVQDFGDNAEAGELLVKEEWYKYKNLSKDVVIVSSFTRDKNEEPHPVSWYHEFEGGRSFYTAIGHSPESFNNPQIISQLLDGIEYAIGDDRVDYSAVKTKLPIEQNRFSKTVLDFNLNEPMELTILPDGRIIFIERKGDVKLYSPSNGKVTTINTIPAWTASEDGLIGLTADPDFSKNNFVYIFYSHPKKSSNVLSRFVFREGKLDLTSEKEILEIPTQRERCCHTGGSLQFSKDRILYISTGDNTSPFESDSYSPSDEQQGRSSFDAQKSSSNTNDLRGKILRIIMNEDGTYSIPEGNLFSKGEPKTRPEIYVMGNRNPFRISVDSRTGFLYWGEVGPDAGEDDPLRGPRGYDEINQARKAGFFGWPYFVGNNFAYNKYDFKEKKSAEKWDPVKPVNNSPSNTGKVDLPPANPALIWYPYVVSPDFPILKTGGRNAMAGPIYYSDDYKGIDNAFPDYLDGKLLIYDWMRNWLFHVSFDAQGDLLDIEPFMSNTPFNNVIDMAYGPDGRLYMVEYGSVWFMQNMDARLVRIDYNPGNRPPVVKLAADKVSGAVPLTVNFTAAGTIDHDGDPLDYRLEAEDKMSTSPDGKFAVTFDKPGIYNVTLTARDPGKLESKTSLKIVAGNEPPSISIDITKGNKTFYFPKTVVGYEVKITDMEDGTSDSKNFPVKNAIVSFDYLEGFDETAIAQGHQVSSGKSLIDASDCKSCHRVDQRSAGPSYLDVAKRYKDEPGSLNKLAEKILKGGAGHWGDIEMAAHPQIPFEDAKRMVEYIFSLGEEKKTLPLAGKVTPGKETNGVYMLKSTFTDNGTSAVPALTSTASYIMRPPKLMPDQAATVHQMKILKTHNKTAFENVKHNSYAFYKNIDLTGITGAIFNGNVYGVDQTGGTIEIRLDEPDGRLLASTEITGKGNFSPLVKFSSPGNLHNVYIIFKNSSAGNKNLFYFNHIEFTNK